MYGNCGIGAYCLGGCDPRSSFQPEACMPAPVCEDRKMKMNSMDGILDISKYLGDPDKADWVSQGEPVVAGGSVLLTMPKQSVGTVLASTVYMWYGNVKARMKTSRGRGVITAFILFSDVQDEVDYEWVGVDLETAQTNYYWHGLLNHTNSANISTSDSFKNWHEYELDWTPDELKWIVDGEVERSIKKADTYNATSRTFEYPQTPSRVMLSIWPGGDERNAQGTIDWAGGVIDWEHEDITGTPGYFYATVSDVEINCFNADNAPGTNKRRSYTYEGDRFTNDTVIDGDLNTVLKSFQGSGLNTDKDDDASATESGTARATPTNNQHTVPGGGSTDPGNTNPGEDDGDSGSGSGGSGGNSGGGGSSGGDTGGSSCDARTWCQDEDDNGNSDAAGSEDSPNTGSWAQEKTMGASAFAGLVALVGLFLV